MDIFKAIITVKSLSLGWSVFWRTVIVSVVNMIFVGIAIWLSSLLGDTIASIVGIIISVYAVLFQLMAMGWAVQRIKDKL